MQLLAWPGEHKDLDCRSRPSFVKLRLQVTEPLARELEDFQAADDPPPVIWMQLRGQEWVDDLQSLVQRRQRQRFQLAFDLLPKLPIRWRALLNAPQQGLQIQRRP